MLDAGKGSRIEHRASRIEHRASRIEDRVSRIVWLRPCQTML
ncbi:MAG: hypothetical protein AB1797_02095 [bacterium]